MINLSKVLKNIDKIINVLQKEIKRWEDPVVTKVKKEGADPFKVLVTTILSARTRDTITEKTARKLFEKIKKPEDLKKINLAKLERIIKPVGFYRRKSFNLKKLAEILIEKYGGRVPNKMEELLTLPGVGRKTANLVLIESFDKDAICVDTHVHRISNRLGIVKTKTPEQTEEQLRKVLPEEYWKMYNKLLVIYGQNLCKPIKALCEQCRLKNYCNFYRKKRRIK